MTRGFWHPTAVAGGVISVVTGLLLAAVVLLFADVRRCSGLLGADRLCFAGLALASAPRYHGIVSVQGLLAGARLFLTLTLAVVAVGT
jgi:hypothetical protein